MDNKVFVVHSSEIIRQGLYSLVKSLFEVKTILIDAPDELKDYSNTASSRLILLADAQLNKSSLEKLIQALFDNNNALIIYVHESANQLDCKEGCNCCFSIYNSTARIEEILRPYFQPVIEKKEAGNSSLLSERETDVVKHVALGKTNKEIAEELFISIHTVISHRKNITEKLGIKSISGLTVYAILNNLIDASSVDLE